MKVTASYPRSGFDPIVDDRRTLTFPKNHTTNVRKFAAMGWRAPAHERQQQSRG